MIRSMTAFARQQLRTEFGEFIFEIRTVNQRFLDLFFRLPETFKYLEMDLRQSAADYLSRGKVEINLNFVPLFSDSSIEINYGNLKQLAKAIDSMQNIVFNLASVSGLDLMKWPGIIKTKELDEQLAKKNILLCFQKTMEKLIEQREKEGAALKVILLRRVYDCQAELKKVEDLSVNIKTAFIARIKEKFAVLKSELDANRLEQEIVFLLQKSDISEEIDRLKTHLNEVKEILNKGGVVGRRLDFLMQELNREANTLGAKSILLESSNVSIELKVLIEQMREQIQNIE